MAHHPFHCSFRRVLSNNPTCSIAAALLHSLSVGSIHMSNADRKRLTARRKALLYAVDEPRRQRRIREELTETLYTSLKHRSLPGLVPRGDSYVSVKELLNYHPFRTLSFPSIQKVVNEDSTHRFELLNDPLKSGDDSWWIRVKDEQDKDVKFEPILKRRDVQATVYSTTLEAWKSSISLIGISRGNDKHIVMFQGMPFENFFTSEQPLSTQVLIYINVCRAMDMGIRFFVGSKPSPSLTKAADLYSLDSDPPPSSDREIPSAISSHHKNSLIWFVTPGNEAGLLPPECFSNVELVRIKRRILWTPVEGVLERELNDKNKEEILDFDLERRMQRIYYD